MRIQGYRGLQHRRHEVEWKKFRGSSTHAIRSTGLYDNRTEEIQLSQELLIGISERRVRRMGYDQSRENRVSILGGCPHEGDEGWTRGKRRRMQQLASDPGMRKTVTTPGPVRTSIMYNETKIA